MKKLVLMNSTMMPNPGQYICKALDKENWIKEVKKRIAEKEIIISAIGYPQNAELLSKWLGFQVPVNKQSVKFKDGDEAAVMRLRYRLDSYRKGEPVNPEDFEFFWVFYKKTE